MKTMKKEKRPQNGTTGALIARRSVSSWCLTGLLNEYTAVGMPTIILATAALETGSLWNRPGGDLVTYTSLCSVNAFAKTVCRPWSEFGIYRPCNGWRAVQSARREGLRSYPLHREHSAPPSLTRRLVPPSHVGPSIPPLQHRLTAAARRSSSPSSCALPPAGSGRPVCRSSPSSARTSAPPARRPRPPAPTRASRRRRRTSARAATAATIWTRERRPRGPELPALELPRPGRGRTAGRTRVGPPHLPWRHPALSLSETLSLSPEPPSLGNPLP